MWKYKAIETDESSPRVDNDETEDVLSRLAIAEMSLDSGLATRLALILGELAWAQGERLSRPLPAAAVRERTREHRACGMSLWQVIEEAGISKITDAIYDSPDYSNNARPRAQPSQQFCHCGPFRPNRRCQPVAWTSALNPEPTSCHTAGL